ncbi:MAG: PIG-L deacetylase family protein [Thermodesulfobacteriota bacterium]
MNRRNVLGIGAHYDDLDLGCSGTLIKHASQGDKVTMLVVTDSAYRNPKGQEIRNAAVARREGEEAAAMIGADLVCLDYKTFEVPFDENLTRTIHGLIVNLNIDTVYSHWTGDLHRDHQHAGKAALMAGRHVPRFLMYRSNYYESGKDFQGNFYSDISAHIETKLNVIRCHRSELERVQFAWIDFFTHQNRNDGLRIGCQYAEALQVVRYLC